MTANSRRPINLALSTISLPLPAVISILHRISGLILFLLLPCLLWILQYSLVSEDNFVTLQSLFSLPIIKVILWVVLLPLLYHLFAGIRHMVMDIGVGETLKGGRLGAKLVMLVTFLAWIAVGVRLW